MANHSAREIANEFLKRRKSNLQPQQMLIQKLVYIAHGWNLAINNEPLVAESPEAWDNGPVFRSLWDHIRDYGYKGENRELCDQTNNAEFNAVLSQSETAVIDHVWNKYGQLGAAKLSRMTHEPDTPWSKAYFSRGKNAALDNQEIKKHYIDLAMAGRAKAA
jgi:uncharacterized phage-associated protein